MRGMFFKGALVGGIGAALVIASSAAIAGTGIGGIFNLGQTNTVNETSALTGAKAGKLLQVTNTSTGAGATALGLNVAAGKSPFTVNSGTKVANLNADRLDGLDSTTLQKRITGTCAGASAIKSVAAGGGVGCTATSPSVRLGTFGYLPVPVSGYNFTTTGGPIYFDFACSGFRAAEDGPGFLWFSAVIDGGVVDSTRVYTNETLSHKATITRGVWFALGAGPHTLDIITATDTQTDINDACGVTMLEFPS